MDLTSWRYSTRFSIVVLGMAFAISSQGPLLASPQSSQSNGQSNAASQSDAAAQKNDEPVPDAPQPQTQSAQQSGQAPAGAAGAKAANPKGAPVAQPVGAAVAPARQRGHRSLLVKVGLLAGAGVAIGTVVALSERSPNRPPGTASSTHP